ncbi:MAG: hypothetical protein Q8O88_02510, partial [bacterium]|nr:hypothetical protein [bacterium]
VVCHFMKIILLTILFSIAANLTFGQTDSSMHSIEFFKNNNRSSINVSEIWIVVDGTKILGEKVGELYRFPIIDSTTTFEFGIKTNRMEFESGPYKAWRLNSGSIITLGKITLIDKLLSVAEYSGMVESDDNYDIFAKRFLIADDIYSIDINDYEKVKQLDYLIINPNQEGDGSYVLTQKIVKLKK